MTPGASRRQSSAGTAGSAACKEVPRPAEVPAADERQRPAGRRQGRRVVALQHQVRAACVGHERRLGLSMRAPEHEHLRARVFSHCIHNFVSEHLPSKLGMTCRTSFLDRQRAVQQQHALPCPGQQAARGRRRQAQVALKFLEDVAQARRQRLPGRHRKRQPFGLPGAVVRVLAEDQYPHLRQGRQRQRPEHIGRVNGGAGGEPRVDLADQATASVAVGPVPQQRRPVALNCLDLAADRLDQPVARRELTGTGRPARRPGRRRA